MNPMEKMEKRTVNKSNMTMKEIRIRKKKVKDDLELLEGNFEKRIQSIKERFLGPFKPVSLIKNKPFIAIGIAVAAGIALGFSKKSRNGKKVDQRKENTTGYSGPGFTGLLIDEMKRIAASRAASYISDFVDQKFSEKRQL